VTLAVKSTLARCAVRLSCGTPPQSPPLYAHVSSFPAFRGHFRARNWPFLALMGAGIGVRIDDCCGKIHLVSFSAKVNSSFPECVAGSSGLPPAASRVEIVSSQ
jgi:hypothetical protein